MVTPGRHIGRRVRARGHRGGRGAGLGAPARAAIPIAPLHLLLFPQHVVTTSTAATRALAKLASLAEALSFAFAHDATVEARALLEGAGVKVLTLRSFGWTDAAYRELHGNTGV